MTSNLFRTPIRVAVLGLGPATGHGEEVST